jgi:membrane protease YdiL (CAAX protease family)
MNPQCSVLLGLNDDAVGQTYAEVFFDETQKENDAFHQLVIDAVYKKDRAHKDSVIFTDQTGKKIYLRVTSSFLKSENKNESGGVVLVLSDITETEVFKKKRYDASIVFSCITACVCLYLLLLATLEFLKINVPTNVLTQVINAMVCVIGFIIYRKTEFSFDELGLKIHDPKRTIGVSILISLSVVVVLIAAKLVITKLSPGFFLPDTPFWNWKIGLYSWISYLFTCVIQEFLARSMIYGSIKKMYDGRYNVLFAILLSSLLFGAVHTAHGFMYLSAAIILLGSLGGLYEKQKNIWGVTIIHYVLGQAACCLGFLS